MHRQWWLLLLIIVPATTTATPPDGRALPQPLPECYAMWLFFGRNFERGDNPTQALYQAQQAFDEFSLDLAQLDIEDLDLGLLQGRIESATELEGPDDSPPGYFRTALENAARQYSQDAWPDNVLGRPCGLVDAVVHFPDGTVVSLKAGSLTIEAFTGKFIGFDYTVAEYSITGPDDPGAPAEPEAMERDRNGPDGPPYSPR